MLAIEPLAQKIRQTEEVRGINVDKEKYKLSLFADDLMLYLTNIKKSLPKAMEIIEDFSKISGYKINFEKTELMQINKRFGSPHEDFRNFQWKKKTRYLGYLSLINDLKTSIDKWSDLPINLLGRIHFV